MPFLPDPLVVSFFTDRLHEQPGNAWSADSRSEAQRLELMWTWLSKITPAESS